MWEKSFDFVSEYKMKNLYDLSEFAKLQNDLLLPTSENYKKYYKNFFSGYEPEPMPKFDKYYYCETLPYPSEFEECLKIKYKKWLEYL